MLANKPWQISFQVQLQVFGSNSHMLQVWHVTQILTQCQLLNISYQSQIL